jgi:hypothetical protein
MFSSLANFNWQDQKFWLLRDTCNMSVKYMHTTAEGTCSVFVFFVNGSLPCQVRLHGRSKQS